LLSVDSVVSRRDISSTRAMLTGVAWGLWATMIVECIVHSAPSLKSVLNF
jgi:FtsH-binding integral membrane protein